LKLGGVCSVLWAALPNVSSETNAILATPNA
jgi:hypothetical protein